MNSAAALTNVHCIYTNIGDNFCASITIRINISTSFSFETEKRYWQGYSLIYNCFSHFQMENYSFLCQIETSSTLKVKTCKKD